MQRLLDKKVRSLIFTSGTVSPLNAFISELTIPIANRLENPHIVKDSHIFAKVISNGSDSEFLVGNYANR